MINIAQAVERLPLLDAVNREITKPIIALLFAAALLLFFWGAFEFLRDASNEESRKTGTQHMLWGVIGLFIMASAYGIINLICGTIGAGC